MMSVATRLKETLRPSSTQNLEAYEDDWQGFLENHTKIKIKGKGIRPWKFNRAQQHLYNLVKANNFTGIYVILKLRQETGMTTWCQGMGYAHTVFRAGRNAMTVSNKQDMAEKQFRDITKVMWRNTSKQLKPRNITNNTRALGFENDSYYDVCCATEAAGRGGSLDFLHMTEVSRFPEADSSWASLAPSMPRDENRKFTGLVFIETTAHGIDWFYQVFHDAFNNAPGFHDWYALFYGVDWFFDVKNPNDVEFLKGQKAILKDKYPEEYPETIEEAFIASGKSYIEGKAIRYYSKRIDDWDFKSLLGKKEARKPVRYDFRETPTGLKLDFHEYGDLHVFRKPVRGHEYILCGDVAEGKEDGDFSTMGVINRNTRTLDAIYRGTIHETSFARHAYEVGKLYDWAWAVFENNGPGHAVMMVLKDLEYRNIYHDINAEKIQQGASPEPGIRMTGKTKHMVLGNMQDWIHRGLIDIPFREVIEELKTLIRLEQKIKARSGCHDDLVMMLSHGLWLLSNYPVAPMKKEDSYIRGGKKEIMWLGKQQQRSQDNEKRWSA